MRLEERVAAVRRFNRFYTQQIGVLNEGLLDSPFSLTEVRVLYELAHRADQLGREGQSSPSTLRNAVAGKRRQRTPSTARELCARLGLDPGYLSRMLRGFARRGLITRQASASDGRSRYLALTAKGRRAFAPLEARSDAQVRAWLAHLSPAEQKRLVERLQQVEQALGAKSGPENPERPAYTLRPPRPGDMGWVTERHGELYAREYGYDARFEALVAEIVAKFLRHFEPARERCWIAEWNGERVGSVFLVKLSAKVAKLRLLLVEPQARGLGIGRRLVEECIRFARRRGYQKIKLWTQSELEAARHLYQATGFRLIGRKRHRDFGKPLVAETWALHL
jgi:DNA-binding MarR family transcriptional regulator/N-acetylglutamate synthase-like GNAT family acetyltransferase